MANRNGYVTLYKPSHPRADLTGMVYEHIFVAEQILGRSLNAGEVVHHEDECRDNNRSENLIVFKTTADHLMYHASGIRTLNEDGSYTGYSKENISTCKQYKINFTKNK